MDDIRATTLAALFVVAFSLGACGGGGTAISPSVSSTSTTGGPQTTAPGVAASALAGARSAFLGAFFRPQGPPPFGIFSAQSSGIAPVPYPSPGSADYCKSVAPNGYSIESGSLVDPVKLADIVNLGVRWTRMPAPQFFDDLSHVFGPGTYAFGSFDSAQCNTLIDHGITPVVNLEAGPVQYSAVLGQLPPTSVPIYASASDFGQWCGVVAAHERSAFPAVTRFTLPGNEVNSNPALFPGGEAQIAAYSEACYAAVKAAYPAAVVYAFELNMDGAINAPGFVRAMSAIGCKVGTCYDGIAMHLSLRYPIPAAGTPCYPNPGGDYSIQCVTDIQTAAGAPIHVLISETVYPVPAYVPDEATKALAVVADLQAFAANAYVDGVSYADVDECALYPTGFFADGCLISASGQLLPAYTSLEQLATKSYQ